MQIQHKLVNGIYLHLVSFNMLSLIQITLSLWPPKLGISDLTSKQGVCYHYWKYSSEVFWNVIFRKNYFSSPWPWLEVFLSFHIFFINLTIFILYKIERIRFQGDPFCSASRGMQDGARDCQELAYSFQSNRKWTTFFNLIQLFLYHFPSR